MLHLQILSVGLWEKLSGKWMFRASFLSLIISVSSYLQSDLLDGGIAIILYILKLSIKVYGTNF